MTFKLNLIIYINMDKNKQDNVRKLIKQLVHREGSVTDFGKICGISHNHLYIFLNGSIDKLGEQVAAKILDYCKKNKIKITMKDLRPHIDQIYYK